MAGIGTDFPQGLGGPFFDWIFHDKGFGRKLADFGEITNPEGIRTIGEIRNLTPDHGAPQMAGQSHRESDGRQLAPTPEGRLGSLVLRRRHERVWAAAEFNPYHDSSRFNLADAVIGMGERARQDLF